MKRLCQSLSITALISVVPLSAFAEKLDVSKYLSMSPLELSNVTVTSVSKKKERASEAASAIFVITHEDIRRSGATSIPELLRIVPGVQVARVDANKWAVSVRGFSDQFSNKLLVMVDGRTIYSPMFSGVYWDVQNVLLEDIERIEVIRGSGGTLWGANAVNGVINIITKEAQFTQGNQVTVGYGTEEQGFTSLRHGGKIADDLYYRAYYRGFNRDAQTLLSGEGANDGWRMQQTGFRSDWKQDDINQYTFQGDYYEGRKDWSYTLPLPSAPFADSGTYEEYLAGGNGLLRWNHVHGNGSESTVQAYVDHATRNLFSFQQNITTVDVDYQNSIMINSRNDLIWGLGYRHIYYDIASTPYILFPFTHAVEQNFSAFIQDKYAIIPEKLFLTVGSKFEHAEYSNFEFQPNVRLAYLPAEGHTFWGAVNRSVRTPSIIEHDGNIAVSSRDPSPGLIRFIKNEDFESEEVYSFEAGYRYNSIEDLSLDTTVFFNKYDNLRTLDLGTPYVESGTSLPPHLSVPFVTGNKGDGEIYGFELSANYNLTPQWNIASSYSFATIDLHIDSDSTDVFLQADELDTAKNIFNIRSRYNFPFNIELDNTLYYVDNLKSGVDSYIRFDTRIGWSPVEGVTVDIVGQNLFDNHHQEYVAGLYSSAIEIDRSVYGKISWKF